MDDSKDIEVGEFLKEPVFTTSGSHCWKYMMKMLGEAIDADVTLKAVGGEVVKAHRSVLTQFSPVFNTMLTCGMQEHQTGVVKLKHVDVEVLKLFLIVMYSGEECEDLLKTNVLDKHLNELINVCYMYEVTHVFPTLSALVKHFVTIENSCGYLSCATKFDLHDSCADYVSKYITRQFSQVVRTDGFMCLAQTHPALAIQLVRSEIEERKPTFKNVAKSKPLLPIPPFSTLLFQDYMALRVKPC